MLKGGEGPLTENSSLDLTTFPSISSVSASSHLPSIPALVPSSSSSSTSSSSAPVASSRYRLLTSSEMTSTLDSFPLAPLSRVLLDWKKADGAWSREAPPLSSFRNFSVGDTIDALDTIRKWYESTVRDVKDNKVFIHFKQWGSHWDEWIDVDSERLAPLHTHTTPAPIKPLGMSSSSSVSSYSSSPSTYAFTYNSNEEGKPNPSGAVGLRNLGNTSDSHTTQPLESCTHSLFFQLSSPSTSSLLCLSVSVQLFHELHPAVDGPRSSAHPLLPHLLLPL